METQVGGGDARPGAVTPKTGTVSQGRGGMPGWCPPLGHSAWGQGLWHRPPPAFPHASQASPGPPPPGCALTQGRAGPHPGRSACGGT